MKMEHSQLIAFEQVAARLYHHDKNELNYFKRLRPQNEKKKEQYHRFPLNQKNRVYDYCDKMNHHQCAFVIQSTDIDSMLLVIAVRQLKKRGIKMRKRRKPKLTKDSDSTKQSNNNNNKNTDEGTQREKIENSLCIGIAHNNTNTSAIKVVNKSSQNDFYYIENWSFGRLDGWSHSLRAIALCVMRCY